MFRYSLLAILLSLQLMVYLRSRRWLIAKGLRGRPAWYVANALFVVFDAALVALLIRRIQFIELAEWFRIAGVYPFFIWHGATFIIGLVLLVAAIVKLPFLAGFRAARLIPTIDARWKALRGRSSFQRFDASRRTFIRRGMYGVTGLSFAGCSYGLLVGREGCDITEAEFPIAGLDPRLNGFTIGLISDIHSSLFMTRPEMDHYVSAVMGLHPDMIVVPGDFVNSQTDEVYPFAESFHRLQAPQGVFGVMGNHDFYVSDPELVAREVNDCGITLLRNDSVVVARDGARFLLSGIDDVGRPDIAAEKLDGALKGFPADLPRILLCHRPYFLPRASEKNVSLMLSGHTHGGQIVLARVGDLTVAPAALASRYVWGKYRYGNCGMYVSRGIGTVGLPVRINCPPEITAITLVSA